MCDRRATNKYLAEQKNLRNTNQLTAYYHLIGTALFKICILNL
uniref:Uncharacterized protein n=1 Tax=Anguilla anguilla TaxID=7936 RepID=A0A0E9XVU0_ANGAN